MKPIITFLLILFSATLMAQNGEKIREKKEQLKSMKIAFITEKLDLTSDEAAKFWPIYNAFDEKQKEIRHEKMKGYMNRLESDASITEKEANTLLTQIETSEDDLYNLRKKFILNLKSIIPAIKIIKLKKAEEEFNRKLLRQVREKK